MAVIDSASVVLEKGLPTNTEAEQFVLGSILLNDAIFPQAAGALEVEDFSLEKHRRIFQRMGDLQERGDPIDNLTLINELEKHDQLDSVDGMAYVAS